jgi:glycosyltransferase involved in cell wall biosynthesis
MKITVIAPDLSGGGGTRAYLIAQVLSHLNHQVKVIGCLFGSTLYPVPPDSLEVHWLKGSRYPGFLATLYQLSQWADGEVLYAIKPRPTSLVPALWKRMGSQQRVILDIDDWEMSWFGGEDWHYRPTPRQLLRDVLKPQGALRDPHHPFYLKQTEKLTTWADAITVNTHFLQHRYGGTYLPSGKDTNLFDPNRYDPDTCRRKFNLENYRVLMFPGTARPHKGLEDALMALDHLNQSDLRLVLVGGRTIEDNYVQSLQQRWSRWIIKLPPVPLNQMPEVVAAAHLVIVPQRDTITAQAQFPIKLTDGMSMAKPIISTTVGDIPQCLQDIGFLAQPSDPQGLAAQIEAVFGNFEVAEQQAKAGRLRCQERYSLEAMANILDQVLQRL